MVFLLISMNSRDFPQLLSFLQFFMPAVNSAEAVIKFPAVFTALVLQLLMLFPNGLKLKFQETATFISRDLKEEILLPTLKLSVRVKKQVLLYVSSLIPKFLQIQLFSISVLFREDCVKVHSLMQVFPSHFQITVMTKIPLMSFTATMAVFQAS